MPNWCANRLEILSDNNNIQKLLLNEQNEIDFSILIPKPNTLNIETKARDGVNLELLEHMQYMKDLSLDQVIGTILKSTEGRNILPKNRGLSYKINEIMKCYNRIHFGSIDWREWSLNNWGTKNESFVLLLTQ